MTCLSNCPVQAIERLLITLHHIAFKSKSLKIMFYRVLFNTKYILVNKMHFEFIATVFFKITAILQAIKDVCASGHSCELTAKFKFIITFKCIILCL